MRLPAAIVAGGFNIIRSLSAAAAADFRWVSGKPTRQGEGTHHHDDDDGGFSSREEELVSLFKPCRTMRDLSQIHARLLRSGFDQHVFVAGRLISFCAVSDSGSMDYAAAVFERLRLPDGFLWNTMIRGFIREGRDDEAFSFFRRMRHRGKPPDSFTFSFLLKMCGRAASAELGKQVHGVVLKHGLDSHVFVGNTVVHMYGLLGDMATARRLFDEMPSRDVVSWNTLLDGHVHCGEYGEALRAFSMMQESGFRADDATSVAALAACSELGDLDSGRRVHSIVAGAKLDRHVSVCNSLIDMYAKCGAVDRALGVFRGMRERNAVSWNSMIMAHAMHGHPGEALKLFDEMREQKQQLVEPNDITFLGVLCACSHGGMVEDGRRYFDIMRKEFAIVATIKHYGCMVDLLGRVGLVREAYEMIRGMPMEGNAVVWRTLLGACRLHGDVELAEEVRRRLAELEDHSSDYVLLSHVYAGAGRWGEVLEVREEMRWRRVGKPHPGNSLASAS